MNKQEETDSVGIDDEYFYNYHYIKKLLDFATKYEHLFMCLHTLKQSHSSQIKAVISLLNTIAL